MVLPQTSLLISGRYEAQEWIGQGGMGTVFRGIDLQTGDGLWQDGLSGFGYGVASLALPGQPVTPAAATMEKKRADEAASSSTAHNASN